MFLRLLFGHMLGDYVLQTYEIARDKRDSFRGVVVHTLILLVSTAIVLWQDSLRFWPWLLLLGVLHAAQDQLRSWAARRFEHPLAHGLPALLIDQALHVVVMAFIAHHATGQPWFRLFATTEGNYLVEDRLIVYGIVFIFLVWTAPILEMEAVNTVQQLRGERGSRAIGRISQWDRVAGALERMAIVIFVALGVWFLAPLALVPRIYARRQELRRSAWSTRAFTQLATSLLLAGLAAYFLDTVPGEVAFPLRF